MNKTEQAVATCEHVLDGIENTTITTSSALLQCLRIARLLNDEEAIKWLQFEYSGYPRDEENHILSEAWEVGYKNGRGYIFDGKKMIFTSLASELEESILSKKHAINNFTTQGASTSGELAYVAMNNLTTSVTRSTGAMITEISQNRKNLSILQSKYYDYALRKHIELTFGNVAQDVFSTYRESVDKHFMKLSSETILKLNAIEDKINSDNPELFSQALTTCRRLFENTATELFTKHLPNYSLNKYMTKSGKEIDISGDHYKNKLSAVIEVLQDKSVTNSVVGSNVLYTLDWIDNLSNLQCKGVHSDITKQEAMQCIIHTYICLGDILSLQE